MSLMEGTSWYGREAPATLREWVRLRMPVTVDAGCAWELGCGGTAVGYQRDKVTARLVLACDAHRMTL